jgi:hypothetical protein
MSFGIIRVEILVHAAVGNGRAGLLLHAGEHLGEPLALAGFIEIAGRLAGTRSAFSAMRMSSALRTGSVSFAATSRASTAWRLAQSTMASADDDHRFEEGLLLAVVHRGSAGRGRPASPGLLALMSLKPRFRIFSKSCTHWMEERKDAVSLTMKRDMSPSGSS